MCVCVCVCVCVLQCVYLCVCVCVYLPEVVMMMMAPAQHLKDDSTAPIAVTSVGSELSGVKRRSSSNSC